MNIHYIFLFLCSRLNFFQERLKSLDRVSASARSASKGFCVTHWKPGAPNCLYFDILKLVVAEDDVLDQDLDQDIQIAVGCWSLFVTVYCSLFTRMLSSLVKFKSDEFQLFVKCLCCKMITLDVVSLSLVMFTRKNYRVVT